MRHEYFLEQVVNNARVNVSDGGGPFAALVVCAGKIIGSGVNRVTSMCDPSAHAEVMAIRDACNKLSSHQLTGCILYSSCEPCPMCLGAIYWSRLDKVYYAATHQQAAQAGFDDSHIYQQINVEPGNRVIPFQHMALSSAFKPFEAWNDAAGSRIDY